MSLKTKAKSALRFNVLAECSTTKARVSQMELPHAMVDTPVFMPVGTQGTLKGLLPEQLEKMDCRIILGNTYHLGNRPGLETIRKAGGLHQFMNWNRALLTDSGGFQMVSLLELAEITETGVKFKSPYDNSECMLTPEHSIEIQTAIGADIMMQLDDVVDATHTDADRFEEARKRTVRWLDRCLNAHEHPDRQNLFPIVQGGLDEAKRRECAAELMERDVPGFAVGGLSGGEAKDDFWRMVNVSTDALPTEKPRYLMGVGFAVDLVVCSALGIDMFDCVFPTRTARFGRALIAKAPGSINLKSKACSTDFGPLEEGCDCTTCTTVSRAYIHSVVKEASACHMITVHNVAFQLRLMRNIRSSILEDRFPAFIQEFMLDNFPSRDYPEWTVNALKEVGVNLS